MAPTTFPSPSKKLLISDPKPKAGSNSASSSSAVSTPPLPEKRTRDQPNLSDCHCCSRRITNENPKDRLQPMDSVWRIVLLCRKCRRSVCSGKTCPYCFQVTGNSGDLCTCKVCQRKIHKDCVKDYGKCTPWCYLGAGFEGFKVCVDCWVPELLKKSVQVARRSGNRGEGKGLEQHDKGEGEKKGKKVGKAKEQVSRRAKGPNEDDLVDGASGSLAKSDRGSIKAGNSNCSGETEATNDAKFAIQLHRVINSSPRILRGKAFGNAIDVEASNIRNWKGLSYKRSALRKKCSGDKNLETGANDVVNDKMNQTVENGISGLSSGLIPYRRDKKRNIWLLDIENMEISESTSSQQAALKSMHSDDTGDGVEISDEAGVMCSYEAAVGCSLTSGAESADTLEYSIGDNVLGSNFCIDGCRFGQELISYKRTRFRKKVCGFNDLLGVSGDSSSCGNPGVPFKSECFHSDNANLNTSPVVKSDSEEISLFGGSDTERGQDRYHLKYVKRIPGKKMDPSFLQHGTFLSENQVPAPVSYSEADFPANGHEFTLPNEYTHATDRYSFKYTKRVKSTSSSSNSVAKLYSNACLAKIGESATGLTTNYSADSRTVSDVSLDSFNLPQ